MTDLKKEAEGPKTVCPECDSELIVEISSCPICGSDIPGEDERSVNEAESAVREKMTLIYNLLFWAEELQIDTRRSYELLSNAWDELRAGDLEESERFLDKALEEVFKPMVKTLRDDLREKSEDIENADLSKKEISELASLVGDAVESKEDDDLDEALSLLIDYKMKLER
ncbi:MAG: hypothetical protein V5A88_01445 [Candidatus Thermoplasmatota archaeon]